jgi:ubiquinone/menaquinone biosynthesis C-methylase UbiE
MVARDPRQANVLYPLGYSDAEARRLQKQASTWNPLSRHLFIDAGIGRGMSVLDLGCGAGDVSFLLGELVGQEGHVLGIDRNPQILEIARKRLEASGAQHITFNTGNIEDLSGYQMFDAVVGRAILLYVPEPIKRIQTLKRLLRPGGIVAFQEPDLTLTQIMTGALKSFPLFHQCVLWMKEALERTSCNTHISLELARGLRAAGFAPPSLRLSSAMAGPEDRVIYEWTAEIIQHIAPFLLQSGLATDEELGLETLAQRLQAEVAEQEGYAVTWILTEAWTYKPDTE